MLMETLYWSTVLHFLTQEYLKDLHTTCILWHPKFDVELLATPDLVLLMLASDKWSMVNQSDDYVAKRRELDAVRLGYNEWILRLAVAIEKTQCEGFIVFQEHIPIFADYFYNASSYSTWRSTRNTFIFVYSEELLPSTNETNNYFAGLIFHDQPNVLLVTAEFMNSTIFDIRTNHFDKPRYFGRKPKSANFYTLQSYDAQQKLIVWDSGVKLYNKMKNLKGREIVLGMFDYRPYMVLDYNKQPKVHNHAVNGSPVFIDGTEVRLLLNFCELYNCTVDVDTSEPTEWGDVYANYTAYGLMGMLLNRTTDYIIGGLFIYYEAYLRMDITSFLGRSGVTCLVPAPHPIINWALPLQPFQTPLWLCVMLCLLLESLSLACTRHWERDPREHRWRQSFSFGCVSTLKLFVNQSTRYVVKSYSLRSLLLAIYMIDIILTTVYGGGLAAILTLPKLEEAADSRERLYQHKLIWSGTSYAWISIFDAGAVEPILQGLLERYRILDAETIAAKSRLGQIGIVVERMLFGHLANSEMIPDDALSQLKLMVDDIYFVYNVAYVTRLWPHMEAHNQFVLMWHSSGFDKYWEWKSAAEYMSGYRQNRMAASKLPKLDLGPVPLGINNFIGLILLWCFGMTCSLLAFVGEIWCRSVI